MVEKLHKPNLAKNLAQQHLAITHVCVSVAGVQTMTGAQPLYGKTELL